MQFIGASKKCLLATGKPHPFIYTYACLNDLLCVQPLIAFLSRESFCRVSASFFPAAIFYFYFFSFGLFYFVENMYASTALCLKVYRALRPALQNIWNVLLTQNMAVTSCI